jgi:opacity protein-like surface antigen
MKKLGFLVLCMLCALSVPGANAQTPTNFYVRADAGGSFPATSDLDGFGASALIGGGLGFRILPFLRTDFTLSYRPNYGGSANENGVQATSSIHSLTGFFNAYVDIPTPTPFTPYLGAGLGIGRNTIGTTTLSSGGATGSVGGASETRLAYQAIAGLSYPVFVGAALDLSYHFVDAGRFTTSGTEVVNGVAVNIGPSSGKVLANEIQLGLRVGF